jgi:uncharacterized protein YkwD
MKSSHHTATALAAAILTLSLAACGGGGGGSSNGSGSGGGGGGTTPGGTTISYSALVTSVAAANYAGDNAAVFSELNAARLASNSGLLAQNADLDSAAANHASFMVTNNLVSNFTYLGTNFSGTLGGHYETASYNSASLSGFTGATPALRASYAGYKGSVMEEASYGAGSGADCAASFLNSVYHLIDAMSPAEQIGIAFNPGTGSGSACVIELGTPTSSLGQLAATSGKTTYPANGQINIPTTYLSGSELPQVPVASSYAQMGQPIAISLYSIANSAPAAASIVISSFTLNEGSAGGTPVPATVLSAAGVTASGAAVVLTTDANLTLPGVLVLLPNAPLSSGTTYYVTFTATINGQAVTSSWSFTTA